MFKKVTIILLQLILLYSNISYAASSYGTHIPEAKKWIWGIERSFIIDRNLDIDQGGTNGDRYFLTGSFGIFQWLSFDGKIGMGEMDWNRNGENNNISYSANFAGGYGFRIKGYESEKWGIKSVLGFQHISIHPFPKNQGGDKNEAIMDEWQGSIVISKDVGDLVPYLGTRYGTLDVIKKTNEVDRKRMKAEKNYAVIIGLDYWLNKRTRINLEGIFLDGEEVTVGVSWDF